MGKIIKFPKDNDKLLNVNKPGLVNPIQTFGIISLSALFLFALILNINFQAEKEQARAIAAVKLSSKDSRLSDYILESLNSSEENIEVIYSESPNGEDKFIFEELAQNYNIQKMNNEISFIQIKEGLAGLELSSLPELLSSYRKALGSKSLSFNKIENSKPDFVEYQILEENKKIGSLEIQISPEKRIISLRRK